MAVDVSRIPNNNKFDPVREAILQLQTEIEDTGATIGNGTLTISTSSPLTGSGTFTANQTGPTSISIGIDGAEYLTNITHDTVNQKLVVTYGDGTTADLSLAQYIDDTNLARLVSGSLDSQTGIATFTRDDATTFTVDLSALFDDTDTNDFLTSASFDDSNGIITFGVTNQTSVTVDIDGRYPLIGDLTAVSNDIITSADFSATNNRFKLTLTQADAGTIEASFDDVVLSESMAANYVPYVKVGGGDGDTTNAVLNDSFLKINGSTLELDWGDTVGVYTARDIKMRKDGGGFGTYYEATYAADSVSFLHYASASDIDTAKIGATTAGRIRINDTYSLPVGDGTSGQVLSTNGSGDLSWVAAGGPTTSDLQDVTDNGATTTNSITVNGLTSNDDITTTGNLFIGTVGQQNWIAFSGTTGDGGASATYTTTYIGERIYGGTEQSELIIYKGNDGHDSTASPDRIRMIGANLCFDTYNIAQGYPTDLDGVAALTTTRAMTIDTSQRVGIGVTNPSAKLTVNNQGTGNAATFTSDATSANQYSGITINSTTVSGVEWYGSEIRNINTQGSPTYLNPRLAFFTQDTNTYLPADRTEKMSIDGNGNVDIISGGLEINGTTVIDASRNLTNMGAGSFGGNVTFGGYIDIGSTLYSRSNLEVLNAAGTGWNRWATRSNGQYNLDIGSLDVDGTATFNSVAVFNGQVNYNSEDRSAYWSYDDKVAAVFKPAADDGAVAILFPSIGNSVSDFGYIAFDEDYGEAGVTAGENSALIIGCENDGGGSSDHVRVKGRLVVEADMSSSDPTNAFQVKDGNVTTDLFRVARSGAAVFSSTLNVADRLSVDDAIRLTSNPSITGDSSGVYFWNQAGVGATIASNAFEVRTNGNTTAFSIDNALNATFADDVTVGSYLYVGSSTGISSSGWIHLHRYSSNLNVAVGNNGANINLLVPNGNIETNGRLIFDKENTSSGGDYDFITMGYNGSWSANQEGIASIEVNDGTGTVGRYGITYGSSGGRFVVTDLYDGGYGASGDVFYVRGDGSAYVQNAIGIGRNPSYKLDVNGDTRVSGNIAAAQYRLVSLADANHFIDYTYTGYSGAIIDGAWIHGHQGGELATNYQGDNWSLRWAAGGNVIVNSKLGIGTGTSSASNKLQIYSNDASTSPLVRLENNGTGDASMTFVKTGVHGWTIGLDNSDGYKFKLSNSSGDVGGGTAAITVDTSFRMGIGTTSPSATLDVHAPSTTAPSLTMGASAGQIFKNEDLEFAFGLNNVSPYNGWMQTRFAGNTSRSLAINPLGGSVGIGTNSPSALLDVRGTLRVNHNDTYAQGLLNKFVSTYVTTTEFGRVGTNSVLELTYDIYGTEQAILNRKYANADLLIQLQGSTHATFYRNGDIGIGTTSPQAKLDVNGTVLLGREHGVTQLHNNKDYNNMASGLVWREYNATGTYVHATSSETLSEYIKAYNFTEQGIATTVDSFTRSDDTYAVEFVGYYYATISGTYQFSASSDDSSDFFIDGTRVAYWYGGHGDNNAPTGGTGQVAGSIYLVKGFHRLYARFQEGTGGDSISLWHKIGSGSWEKIPADRLYHKAEDLFRATGSGNATLYGTFTATADIVAYSDERIKENVETIDNALDKVQQLRGVSFNRIKDGSKSIGVIAQEIEKVLPEVVTEDGEGMKGVAYGNVVGVLIEAIKEQQKQIDELKAIINGGS